MRNRFWTAFRWFAGIGLILVLLAFAAGQRWTVVAQGPRGCFACMSAHGISLSTRVMTDVWRIPKLAPWQISVKSPHVDDGGLFFRSDNQQFVPVIYWPGFHIIQGGWGATEWAEFVGFVFSDHASCSVVATHGCLIVFFMACNIGVFLIGRSSQRAAGQRTSGPSTIPVAEAGDRQK